MRVVFIQNKRFNGLKARLQCVDFALLRVDLAILLLQQLPNLAITVVGGALGYCVGARGAATSRTPAPEWVIDPRNGQTASAGMCMHPGDVVDPGQPALGALTGSRRWGQFCPGWLSDGLRRHIPRHDQRSHNSRLAPPRVELMTLASAT